MGKKSAKSESPVPWVKITITPEERLKLRPLPSELTKLYLLINERRDFETNIAGLMTRISDRTFKEGMEIAGTQGRKKWRPTTSLIQRWLGQLENSGLIEQRGKHVFYCPLACVSDKSVKKISDQTATISATTSATKQEHAETPINTGFKEELKNEVRPEVLPQVLPNLYTPLGVTESNTVKRDDDSADFSQQGIFAPFLELISEQGFRFHQVVGNAATTLMIKTWIDKGVTLEQAKTGILEANAYLGERPNTPRYYLERVLNVKKAMDKISQSANEVNHAKPITTNKRRNLRAEADAVFERIRKAETDTEANT